jgi:hypothetical protein
MTAPRNPDDLIRAFLGEGETDLPDRAFDAVRADIHQTRQRVVIGPWREPDMSTFARVAIAAIAVLTVGLAWVNFGPKQPGVGGQPTPTASSKPSPRALTEEFVPLEAGTWVAADPFIVRVTFTVPDGWEGGIGGEYFAGLNPLGRPGGLNFLDIGKVYADPCHFESRFVDLSGVRSVDDFAATLANESSLVDKFPTRISLGGYSGRELIMTAPDTFKGCTLSPDGYAVWQLPLGANYSMQPGQTSRLMILDVGGRRLVIDIPELPGQTAQELAEVLAIVDSIRLAPGN